VELDLTDDLPYSTEDTKMRLTVAAIAQNVTEIKNILDFSILDFGFCSRP
jgi:hypothetical protein